MERYYILNKNAVNNIENKKKINVNLKRFRNVCKINIKFSAKFLFFLFIILIYLNKFYKNKPNKIKKDNYYACFVGMGKQENKYVKELIEYYLKLGVEKFILGDNNLRNTEKLSDVLQDYIDDGIIEIIELFDSACGQSELYNITYEKYKTKCNWFLLFDFDEYLEVHFEQGKNLVLKDFLSNKIFNKCEAILFNWLIYTDNNLIYYDKRPLNKRFTEPFYECVDNIYVKSIVRGNLNKTIFLPNKSNHVPEKKVKICNSLGKIIKHYNPFSVNPPIFDYGYLKHYTDKTAEEYCDKIIKGAPRKVVFNVHERLNIFFKHNTFSLKKLNVFGRKFKRKFNPNSFRNYFKTNEYLTNILIICFFLLLYFKYIIFNEPLLRRVLDFYSFIIKAKE